MSYAQWQTTVINSVVKRGLCRENIWETIICVYKLLCVILKLYTFCMNYCLFVEYLACNVAFNALCECANLRIVTTVILWALVTLIPTYAL